MSKQQNIHLVAVFAHSVPDVNVCCDMPKLQRNKSNLAEAKILQSGVPGSY